MALNPSTTSAPDTNSGELSKLEGGQKGYNILRYPHDLGNQNDVLHYVVFYINIPESSKYLKTNGKNAVDEKSASQKNFDYLVSHGSRGTTLVNGQQAGYGGAVTAGVNASNGGSAAAPLAGGLAATQIDLRPKLKRINTAIAVYMPDTVFANYSHGWSQVSATDAAGKIGENAALAAGAGNAAKEIAGSTGSWIAGDDWEDPNFRASPTTMEGIGKLGEASGALGAGATGLALKSIGQAINPQVELLFTGTGNRSFVFEFKFQARSQFEAQQIRDIIKTFRRFAAPELLDNTQNGRYFIMPAQFDIKFYYNNNENTNLSKISTCVLEDIYVDYADGGQFSTFSDGMPVQISLKMTFKEADIIYRELIEEFGY